MGVRGLLRRLWSDRVNFAAMAVAVTLALVLLAAGPVYSDAVSVAAMRRSVTDVPAGDATISVELRTAQGRYVALDQLATAELAAATAPLNTEITRAIVSGSSYQLDADEGEYGRVDVADLAWLESIDEHATIVVGSWPKGDDVSAATVDIAIDRRAAVVFGLAVGDTLELPPRTPSAAPVTVSVVGIYDIDDPAEPYWRDRDRFVTGVTVSPQFRSTRLVTTRAAMIGDNLNRTSSSWLSIPEFDRLELGDVDSIRRRVVDLPSDLEASRLAGFGVDTGEFEMVTVVPALLASSTRSLTVARSAVFAVVAQFALLAGYALVLVAGLTVDARSSEVAMFRARGASARQLFSTALVEAAILVVPAALIAPRLASWLLRAFDEFGPIASIGLTIDPRPVGAAWIAVGIAAVATMSLLAWPAYRSARRAEQSDHRHARQGLRAGWQRAGVDLALVTVAAAAFWQLASLGDDRAASVRGRFGVDPLVVVAPTFGLIAGSLIALRAIPALGRLAERKSASSTGIVGPLAGWQFARRPTRYARAGLLVIMAVAIGTFSATYEATWTGSQAAQAEHQVGADVRVSPNRRTGDSVTDLHLAVAHEQVDGVRSSVPVVRRPVEAPGADRPGELLALDAERADFDDPDLRAALADLVDLRPGTDGVAIPDGATSLVVDVHLEVPEDPNASRPGESDDPPPEEPVPIRGNLAVTLRDGRGLLHRIDLGAVSEGLDDSTLEAGLAVPGPDRSVLVGVSPLVLMDIEFGTTAPRPSSRDLELRIGSMRAGTPDGLKNVDLSAAAWLASTTRFQFLSEPPSFALVEADPDQGLQTMLATGSNLTPSPGLVHFNLSVPGNEPASALPAIATRSWLTGAELDIGDVVPVEGIQAETTSVEIIGAVESVPTVDPNLRDALVVDLATLQLLEFDSGRRVDPVDEHWLEVDVAMSNLVAIESELGEVPIEATDVLVEERRRAELTSDPPALGAIGALTLGFIAASVFALVGFVLTIVVSARERRLEFALLRALGLSTRQLRRWMLVEQLVFIAAAVVFGTGIGVVLGQLVLPLVSLTEAGTGVYPAVEIIIPWRTIAGLQAVLLAGLLASVVVVTASTRRIATSAMLRAGGDA